MQTSYFKLKSSAALTDSNFGLNTKLKKKYRKRGRGTTKQPQPHSSFFPSSHPFCFVLWCVSGGCWHDSTILLKGFFFSVSGLCKGAEKKNAKSTFPLQLSPKTFSNCLGVWESWTHLYAEEGMGEEEQKHCPTHQQASSGTSVERRKLGSASPESRLQRKQLPSSENHKTDLGRKWSSSNAGQADGKLNQSSCDHQTSHLAVIVLPARHDMTGLVAPERLLEVWTGSSANCLLVKKWSFLWVAGFQGSQAPAAPDPSSATVGSARTPAGRCRPASNSNTLSESGGKD